MTTAALMSGTRPTTSTDLGLDRPGMASRTPEHQPGRTSAPDAVHTVWSTRSGSPRAVPPFCATRLDLVASSVTVPIWAICAVALAALSMVAADLTDLWEPAEPGVRSRIVEETPRDEAWGTPRRAGALRSTDQPGGVMPVAGWIELAGGQLWARDRPAGRPGMQHLARSCRGGGALWPMKATPDGCSRGRAAAYRGHWPPSCNAPGKVRSVIRGEPPGWSRSAAGGCRMTNYIRSASPPRRYVRSHVAASSSTSAWLRAP